MDPLQRWDANLVLVHAQQDFIVDIQRIFRGFRARRHVRKIRNGLIKLQAHVKGKLTRSRYKNAKEMRHEQAAIIVQARWRAFVVRKQYKAKLKAIQRM